MKPNQHIIKNFGNYQCELDTTNSDFISIKVTNISTGDNLSTIYNCEYEPLFGDYDPVDTDNIMRKVYKLIETLSADNSSAVKDLKHMIAQIQVYGVTYLNKIDIPTLELAIEAL